MKLLFLTLFLCVSINAFGTDGPVTFEYKRKVAKNIDLDMLNEMGAEGWEMVACPTDGKSERQGGVGGLLKNPRGYAWSYSKYCYFKRKIN